MIKKIRKKLLSFFLVFTLTGTLMVPVNAASSTMAAYSPTVQGAAISILTGNFTALAHEYFERALLKGIDELSKVEELGPFSEVLDVTKKLLGSPLGNAISGVQDTCNKILDELSVIEDKIDESNEKLDDLLAYATSDKHSYTDARSKIISFKNTYYAITSEYEVLVTALDAYIQDPTSDNKVALETAYATIEKYYTYSADENHTEKNFNFTSDVDVFLETISPYPYGQGIKSNVKASDATEWGTAGNNDTYMDYLYHYLCSVCAFEHEVYNGMMAGMNEISGAAFIYLNAYRLYVEVQTQMLTADASISDEEREKKIDDIWTTYAANAYKVCRGLEQAAEECYSHTKQLMRPYDVDLTMDVGGVQYWSKQKTYVPSGIFAYTHVYMCFLYCDKTLQSQLEFYQLKPIGTNSSYTVLKNGLTNGWASDFCDIDLVDVAFHNEAGGAFTSVSGDYFSLEASDNPAGYSILEHGTDLADLTNANGYNNDLYGFLANHVSVVDENNTTSNQLPAKPTSGNMYAPLYSDWAAWQPHGLYQRDMMINLLNVSRSLSSADLNANEVELDTENDIRDDNSKNSNLVILKATNLSAKVSTDVNTGGSVTLTTENETNANGTNLLSGTPLIAKINPEEGQVIESVSLVLGPSKKTVSLMDTAEASAEDNTYNMATDQDGNYVFKFPVPYQNATLKVVFKEMDKNLNPYTVQLTESTSGDLQFEANNGLLKQVYHAGDEVKIFVRPYSRNLVTSISVTASDNTSIEAKDITSTEVIYAPNTKVYSFTMPASDVTINASYETANIVTLSSEGANNEGTVGFYYGDLNLLDNNWTNSQYTARQGDMVTIVASCGIQYYASEYLATDLATSQRISTKQGDHGMTFVMPAHDVSVKVIFKEITAGNYTAALNITGDGTLTFLDENGDSMNAARLEYVPGDIVTVLVETIQSEMESIKVADTTGNVIELQQDSVNPDLYTFVMPAANVTVSAAFLKLVNVSLDAETSSYLTLESIISKTGDKVYFSKKDSRLAFEEITAVSGGKPLTVYEDGNNKYYVIAQNSDILISAKPSNLHNGAYVLMNSSLYSYSISGYFSKNSNNSTITAIAGEKVYITACKNTTPGMVQTYTNNIIVMDKNGNELELVSDGVTTPMQYRLNYKYYFTMPDCDVVITCTSIPTTSSDQQRPSGDLDDEAASNPTSPKTSDVMEATGWMIGLVLCLSGIAGLTTYKKIRIY